MVDITILDGGFVMVYKPTFTSLGGPILQVVEMILECCGANFVLWCLRSAMPSCAGVQTWRLGNLEKRRSWGWIYGLRNAVCSCKKEDFMHKNEDLTIKNQGFSLFKIGFEERNFEDFL